MIKSVVSSTDGTSMSPVPPWRAQGRYVAGLGLLAVLGFFPFVRGTRVPLLGWIDLAIHEAGHVFAMPLPDLGTAVMGNGLQVLLPFAIAVAFWLKERDPLGTAVALGWTGAALQDASVYIADAPYQRLPLIGGQHDWAWILGPRGVDALDAADELSRIVLVTGMAAWGLGVLWALAGPRLARGLRAGIRDVRPWIVWSRAPSVQAEAIAVEIASRGGHPDVSPAVARGPAAHVGPATGRTVRSDHPDHGDGGPAGGVDPDGGGDPPRARLVW